MLVPILFLAACSPAPKPPSTNSTAAPAAALVERTAALFATPAPVLDRPSAVVRRGRTAGTRWVVQYFHVTDDGHGPVTVADTAGLNNGSQPAQGHKGLPATTRADSFLFTAAPAGSALSGFVCLWTVRLGRSSASACRPFRDSTAADSTPPGPPLPDSTVVHAILTLPRTLRVAAMTPACDSAVRRGAWEADAAHAVPVLACQGWTVAQGVVAVAPLVVQVCGYVQLIDAQGPWLQAANTATKARCRFVFDSLPFPHKLLGRTAEPIGAPDAVGRIRVALR